MAHEPGHITNNEEELAQLFWELIRNGPVFPNSLEIIQFILAESDNISENQAEEIALRFQGRFGPQFAQEATRRSATAFETPGSQTGDSIAETIAGPAGRRFEAGVAPGRVFQSFLGDVLPTGIGPASRQFAERQFDTLRSSFISGLTPATLAPEDRRGIDFRQFLESQAPVASAATVGQRLVGLNDLFTGPGGDDPRTRALRDIFTPQTTFNTALGAALPQISPEFRPSFRQTAGRQFEEQLGGGNLDYLQFLAKQRGLIFPT